MNCSGIVNITLKSMNKKSLKSKDVKKWLKFVNGEINRKLLEQGIPDKIIESIALGVPLFISTDGKVSVVKDYYNV